MARNKKFDTRPKSSGTPAVPDDMIMLTPDGPVYVRSHERTTQQGRVSRVTSHLRGKAQMAKHFAQSKPKSEFNEISESMEKEAQELDRQLREESDNY